MGINMNHGGKRPGAGRPKGSTKPGSKTELLMIRVTPQQKAKALKLGDGNASAGIRIALDRI